MLGFRTSFHTRFGAVAGIVLLALAGCSDAAEAPQTEPAGEPPRIIVSGASGNLGSQAVMELLALGVQPEQLILVSRSPEELADYAALGASTRFGDFTQPESLASAYEGGDRLLLISLNTVGNPNPRVASERQQLHQTAIDAAVAAGVERIVYTSFVDADENVSPIAVDHRATEQMLRDSGVAWTSLRNGWYMDRIADMAAEMVAAGEATVPAEEEGAALITRNDLAAAAAVALVEDGHENETYELTGSETIGVADVARIASEVAEAEIEILTVADTEASLDLDSGTLITDDFEQLTGRTPTTAREFLVANREALVAAN